jgi:hypothetical protein
LTLGTTVAAAGAVPLGTSRRTLALAILALLVVGCAGRAQLVREDLPARDLRALVDSDAAQVLLSDLLAHRSADRPLAAPGPGWTSARGSDDGADPDPPGPHDRTRLQMLAREVSPDFAALAFARAISADPTSRAVQASLRRFVEDGLAVAEQALRQPGAFPYTVLFAPSWMYRSHPETGADFASQRRLLDRLGIPNRLVPSRQDASVEDNAETIAETVRAAARDGARVVVVSASKSGAEAALALARRLAPEESAAVAAWVNIVGALHGSPLADIALRPPVSWVARSVFWLRRWDWAGMVSMATEDSRRRLRGARLPESIAVVNVVAVPLSGTVGAAVWGGYRALRRHGPNDGAVLLADGVWPGGINLVSIGPDHLFAPGQDDAYCLAMLRAVAGAIRLRRVPPEPTARIGSEPGPGIAERSVRP